MKPWKLQSCIYGKATILVNGRFKVQDAIHGKGTFSCLTDSAIKHCIVKEKIPYHGVFSFYRVSSCHNVWTNIHERRLHSLWEIWEQTHARNVHWDWTNHQTFSASVSMASDARSPASSSWNMNSVWYSLRNWAERASSKNSEYTRLMSSTLTSVP